MESIEASVEIHAPLSVVWETLTDGDSYEEWNPFITSAEGTFALGSRPRLRIVPPGGRPMAFRPRVTHCTPERLLQWRGNLLVPGVCDAVHEFAVTGTANGGTVLVQRERFSGLLLPLLGGLLEPTLAGFTAMNDALRQRSEARCAVA